MIKMINKKKGFTLIELMIVVAIIAIIAAIAIPAFLRARITANEGAAVATLKSVFTSEGLFQSGQIVDANGNGSGEFGLVGELSGAYTRDSAGATTGGAGTGQANAFISASLQPRTPLPAGVASSKSGYLIATFLPSNTAVVTDADAQNASAAADPNDAILQEARFRAYAWPNVFNNSGIRCFAVNESGEVISASNVNAGVPIYNGNAVAANIPTRGVAAANVAGQFPVDDDTFAGLFVSGQPANDGQTWVAAGN